MPDLFFFSPCWKTLFWQVPCFIPVTPKPAAAAYSSRKSLDENHLLCSAWRHSWQPLSLAHFPVFPKCRVVCREVFAATNEYAAFHSGQTATGGKWWRWQTTIVLGSLPVGVKRRSCADFPSGSVVKNQPANARDKDSIPGWGRSPGGGHGNPLQSSCLENHTDRGASRATVCGVPKCQAWPSDCGQSWGDGGRPKRNSCLLVTTGESQATWTIKMMFSFTCINFDHSLIGTSTATPILKTRKLSLKKNVWLSPDYVVECIFICDWSQKGGVISYGWLSLQVENDDPFFFFSYQMILSTWI